VTVQDRKKRNRALTYCQRSGIECNNSILNNGKEMGFLIMFLRGGETVGVVICRTPHKKENKSLKKRSIHWSIRRERGGGVCVREEKIASPFLKRRTIISNFKGVGGGRFLLNTVAGDVLL